MTEEVHFPSLKLIRAWATQENCPVYDGIEVFTKRVRVRDRALCGHPTAGALDRTNRAHYGDNFVALVHPENLDIMKRVDCIVCTMLFLTERDTLMKEYLRGIKCRDGIDE